MKRWQEHSNPPDAQQWNACVRDNVLLHIELLPRWPCSWLYFTLGQPYRAVFALPYQRKWGIGYAFQPQLLPWLSVEGICSDDELKALQTQVLQRFAVVDFLIASSLPWPSILAKWTNFYLPLSAEEKVLEKRWTPELRKNLRKAGKHDLRLGKLPMAEPVVQLFREVHGHHHTKVDYGQLTSLANQLLEQGHAQAWFVSEKGIRRAAILLLDNGHSLGYWLAAPTPEGRQQSALHWGLSELMKMHCGQRQRWDFMGSDLPHVARLYRQFGPETGYYYHVYQSNGFIGWAHRRFLRTQSFSQPLSLTAP